MGGKRKVLPFLLAAALLAGCKARLAESPAPTESVPAVETSAVGLTPEPEPDWEGMLAHLQPENIRRILRDILNDSISPETLAPLVRQAMKHPVEYRERENGDDRVWSVHFTLGADWRDGEMTLYAGLEENLVGLSLPGKMLWLEDEELYQLVRTSMDREWVLNEYWYERCKNLVDGFYNELLEETGFSSWELVEFAGYCGTSKVENEGITVFRMGAAFRTDPPELAPNRLVGGQYVDSQLRVHGLPWYPVHLVTIDGEAIGLTYDDWLDRYPGEDPLDHYTEEEIREMVAHAEEHQGG